MSQRSSTSNVEIIDLTDETINNNNNDNNCNLKHNQTITIDDSFGGPIECISSEEDEDIPCRSQQYIPDPSPVHVIDEPSTQLSEVSQVSIGSSSSLDLLPASPTFDYQSSSSLSLSSPKSTVRKKARQSTPRLTKAALQHQKKLQREEAKKQKLKQKEEEKLVKDANRANAANKALDNCTANIDKKVLILVNDPDEVTLKTLFDESMIKYKLTDYSKIENSITWTYKQTEVVDNTCVPRFNDSNWLMIFIQGSDYLKKLLAYKNNPCDTQSIKSYLSDIRRRTNCDIILMVYNLSNYLKSERAKEAKSYRKTFKDRFEKHGEVDTDETPGPSPLTIGVTELQDLRLKLEMEYKREHTKSKLHLEFYEKTSEVIHMIVRYTLSIAKYQVKQKVRTSTGLDWAINMDKERAVDPTKSREDLTKLWVTQLQQFSQVTLPIAKAIAAEYPFPSALLDQYNNLTTSEAEDLLAELYVQRNLKRQIGPNISRRVYCFMTCKDPDVHIGLS